jgi:hypothetical protein
LLGKQLQNVQALFQSRSGVDWLAAVLLLRRRREIVSLLRGFFETMFLLPILMSPEMIEF